MPRLLRHTALKQRRLYRKLYRRRICRSLCLRKVFQSTRLWYVDSGCRLPVHAILEKLDRLQPARVPCETYPYTQITIQVGFSLVYSQLSAQIKFVFATKMLADFHRWSRSLSMAFKQKVGTKELQKISKQTIKIFSSHTPHRVFGKSLNFLS